MRRRDFLSAAVAVVIAGHAGMNVSSARSARPYRMPPEWAPHERCVMCFSAAWELYGEREVHHIRREQARLAKAIRCFEPVTLLANAEDVADARRLCGPHIDIVAMPVYDIWARDTLASVVFGAAGGRHAVDWNFNVWGEKFNGYDRDRDLARRYAAQAGLPRLEAGLVTESGAFEIDGAGTLLTTETALLNPNRNPGLSKADIEAEFRHWLGVDKIVWVKGSDADAVTDGHIDGIAKFLAPGKLAVEVSDDPADPEFKDLRENARRLAKLSDARGGAVEVVEVLRPRWDEMPEHGDDFSASYVNCYLANGAVVMPKFGDRARDGAAREVFQRLSGARQVIQVSVDRICEGGGGIHCNTQQIPAVS